jgi:hypothetical protein
MFAIVACRPPRWQPKSGGRRFRAIAATSARPRQPASARQARSMRVQASRNTSVEVA